MITAVARKLVLLLVQKGKDDLLPVIVTHLDRHSGAKALLPETVRNMIASVKIMTGKKAPDLIWKAPVLTQTKKTHQDIILKTGALNTDPTILLFYQGECQLCEDALIDLANAYDQLSANHVRVIAVSGDDSEKGFRKRISKKT